MHQLEQKEKFYQNERKGSTLFVLEKVVYEQGTAVYTFLDESVKGWRCVNSFSHEQFCGFIVRQGVTIGTKMLLNFDLSGQVQFAEVV